MVMVTVTFGVLWRAENTVKMNSCHDPFVARLSVLPGYNAKSVL